MAEKLSNLEQTKFGDASVEAKRKAFHDLFRNNQKQLFGAVP